MAHHGLPDEGLHDAFGAAVTGVRSPAQQGRVLHAWLETGDLPGHALTVLLRVTAGVESDRERASVLTRAWQTQAVSGEAEAAFFKALAAIDDSGSRLARPGVLIAVARKQALGQPTVLRVIEGTRAMAAARWGLLRPNTSRRDRAEREPADAQRAERCSRRLHRECPHWTSQRPADVVERIARGRIGRSAADVHADLSARRMKTATPAIPFSLSTYDGRTLSLSDYKGKVFLPNFWYPG